MILPLQSERTADIRDCLTYHPSCLIMHTKLLISNRDVPQSFFKEETDMEITLTEKNFQEEVLNSDKPVLVDFWADWCGPCRMLAPTIAQLAEEHAADWKVGKVNVDNESGLAVQYEIFSIPTLLVFSKGQLVNRSVGVISKAQVEALVP